MKRTISFLTAVLMAICVTVPAFARDSGVSDRYLSAKETGFRYSHSPLDDKMTSGDIVVNPDSAYGFSPDPSSKRIGGAAAYDWTDPLWVNKVKRERIEAYGLGAAVLDPALDACLGLYDQYFTAYVEAGLVEAYSQEDDAFVSGWGENRPDDRLWAEYEDIYRNPEYYDGASGDINWPENDGFYGSSFDYTLKPYTVIDRYGSDYGTFVALVGHPYSDYSLAPGSKYKNYSVFIVRKPIQGKAGAVYPWFDEPGGATQIVLPSPVKDLIADGSLERVVYR